MGALAACVLLVVAMLTPTTATAAPQTIVSDTMTRSVLSGWGTATPGGAWTTTNDAAFKVNGSFGTIDLTRPGDGYSARLNSVNADSQDLRLSMALADLPAQGNGVYSSVHLRQQDGYSYRALVQVEPGGKSRLIVQRVDDRSDAVTTLSSDYSIPTALKAGEWLAVAFSVSGTNPVTLKAKAWPKQSAEPEWQISTTDASAERLAGSGALEVHGYTSRSSGTAQLWYDDIMLTTQTTTNPVAPAPPSDLPPASSPAVSPGAIGGSGAVPVGSAHYPVPSNAVYVSPSGSDAGSGSVSAPYKTVARAVAVASTGSTIVLRAGSYHESVTIDKTLTIQNYPGEAVWFDGSSAVSDFVRAGSTWRLDGWTADFDSSPSYTFGARDGTADNWAFLDPAHPMAAHPDQVWIDGVAQKQASSLADVRPGWFYVDKSGNRLYLGSDPTGKSVRASHLQKALTIRGPSTVVRGVGVRKYAPSIPHMGTVTAERGGVQFENVELIDNATTGLSLLAAGVTVNKVTVARSGMLGIHANEADNLTLSGLKVTESNTENFNQSPVSGGTKITRTRGITVDNSTFDNNSGPGLWLDESTYNSTVTNSTMRGNKGHGLSLEISGKSVIANNLITNNARFGLKINDASEVRIWNNTLVDNDRPVNIVQDNRRASNLSLPGHDSRQQLPDPTVTWITGPVEVRNNVLNGTTGNCLLCVEDYSKQYSAEQMRVTALGNLYQRDNESAPEWVVVWSRGSGNPSVFTSLNAFKSATGQESASFALDGPDAVDADGRLTSTVATQAASVAQPLPSDLATLTGRPSGTRQLGVIW